MRYLIPFLMLAAAPGYAGETAVALAQPKNPVSCFARVESADGLTDIPLISSRRLYGPTFIGTATLEKHGEGKGVIVNITVQELVPAGYGATLSFLLVNPLNGKTTELTSVAGLVTDSPYSAALKYADEENGYTLVAGCNLQSP